MTTVQSAFRWSRIHAVRHMAACEQAWLRWSETSITEVVTSRAAQAVTVVPFTQHAEARSGADWVWWWIDGRGAYGMLVQAKRLTITGGTWSFDFDYPQRTGTQRRTLMSTAAYLGLLPAYALYLGTPDYRDWERCSDYHASGRCLECVQRSVSLMPALLAEVLAANDAVSTYERSVALENLWVRARSRARAPILPLVKEQMTPELLRFLTRRQDGRAVTRSMIDRVLQVRYGAFTAVAEAGAGHQELDGGHDQLGSVFDSFPSDPGHWGVDYLRHTLAPLVHAPPDYVLGIMTGDYTEDHLPPDMPELAGGVVVVDLRRAGE